MKRGKIGEGFRSGTVTKLSTEVMQFDQSFKKDPSGHCVENRLYGRLSAIIQVRDLGGLNQVFRTKVHRFVSFFLSHELVYNFISVFCKCCIPLSFRIHVSKGKNKSSGSVFTFLYNLFCLEVLRTFLFIPN